MRSSRPAGPPSGVPQASARSSDKLSQHPLAEQQSPATAGSSSTAAAPPSSASSNPALAAANQGNGRSSFDARPPPTPQQQQQHLQQNIHDDQSPTSQDYLQHPAADPAPAYDPQFADQVSRSQSHRYSSHAAGNPQTYAVAATSVEDFRRQSQLVSPPLPQAQAQILPPHLLQQQQQPPIPASAPEPPQKHSKRNILTKVFGRSHRSDQSVSKGDSYPSSSSSTTLRRKDSTRHSVGPPPAVRTGPSQISLEQQPSPLQGVGEFTPDPNYRSLSNQDLLQQPRNPQDPHHSSIRPVQPESDPQYSAEDLQYQQQQHQIAQAQGDQQQYQYSQVVYDADQQPQSQSQYQGPQHPQYPAGSQPPFLGQLSTSQHQNPETVSQLSHESPVTDQDQRSANNHSAQASPAVAYSHQAQDLQQPPQQTSHQHPLPPPQPAMSNSQRRQEMDDALRAQVDPALGSPSAYRQLNRPPPPGNGNNNGNNNNTNMNPLPPPPPGASGQPPNYRPDQRQFEGVQEQQRAGDHGRHSPQPAPAESTASQEKMEMKELVTKYKNVKRLYFDGKSQIEQLSSQVEQLQNAIANQRMSQSRTMLDDNEYNKLFERLNGAITNLSFNIRKDWRALPQWIDRVVSPDALKTGKQEMTAVGRAIITHWVMEEIFNKCFHPGLDPELSSSLKEIERNIRLFSYTMNMREEHDALTSKIVSWRMTTLEGLDRRLNSAGSKDNFAAFTEKSTTNLTIYLNQFMTDPPPAGVQGSVSMIVELAIKIAANIPLESRDLAISYPLPGDQIHKDLMEVEKTPLPPLPGGDGPGDDAGSVHEDKEGKGGRPQSSKPGMLTKLGPAGLARKGSTSSSIVVPADAPPVPTAPLPKDPTKVRLAGFVVVEVRGKHTLIKAPVWSLG